MKLVTVFLLFGLISFTAFWMLHDLPLSQKMEMNESEEESEAKAAWELAMLQDPQTGEIPKGIRLKEFQFLREFNETYKVAEKQTRSIIWNERGPWNVGGRTRAFSIDVSNEKHIVAASVSSGIWQSFDEGTTWSRATDVNTYAPVISITQDKRPGKTNIWYAMTGELSGNSAGATGAYYFGDGALVSLDNGETWKANTSTADEVPSSFSQVYQNGWRIVSSPVDTVSACVYLATYGSLFRSIDTGNSWKIVLGSGNDSYYTDVAVSKTGIVYATMSSDGVNTKGFYRSGDGVHFTNITPSFLSNYDRTVLEINPNNENEVYFLSELAKDSSGGVISYNYEGSKEYVSLVKYTYLSGDGSGTAGQWENLSQNLPVSSPNQFDKFNCQGGYDLTIRCQPGSNTIIIGGTNLYRSTDGFTSINNTTQIGGYGVGTVLANFTTYPNHHPDQHDLFFLPSNPNKLYSTSDGGVNFTNDVNAPSVSWTQKSLGYITSQLYSVSIDQSKAFDQWVLGGLQDNGNFISKSNSYQALWRQTVNGDGAYNYIAPNRDFYVISTQLGNVRKVKLDEKGNVMLRRRIDPIEFDKANYNFINVLDVDPVSNDYLFMPIGKRFARLNHLKAIELKNDDNKLSSGWTISKDTIKTAKTSSTAANAEISTFAISQTDNRIYFGTSNREVYRIDNANTNDSLSWKMCSIARLPAGGYVSGIAIDPDSSKNVLLSYSNYNINSLFYSNDTGNTWYYVGGNLEGSGFITGTNPSIRCVKILVDAQGKRRYFAGTSVGLFSTDSLVLATNVNNSKTVWTHESPEKIGASVVTDIKVRQKDGYIVIGTHGNGIFDSYYTGLANPNPVPISSTLQVYPNPANSFINYSFENVKEEDIQIEIFNMNGQRVKRILAGRYKVGQFTIPIDVSQFPSGHYFVGLANNSNKKLNSKHFVVAH